MCIGLREFIVKEEITWFTALNAGPTMQKARASPQTIAPLIHQQISVEKPRICLNQFGAQKSYIK
jgi:hypothetical protein